MFYMTTTYVVVVIFLVIQYAHIQLIWIRKLQMTPEGIAKLKKFLIAHEGIRLKAYKDIFGNLTIGVGHKISLEDIVKNPAFKNDETFQKAMQDLDSDIAWFLNELSQFDWFNNLNEDRQIVIVDMTFNLGLNGFLKFHNLISDLIKRDDIDAEKEMDNSEWAHQVQPSRVKDDEQGILTGHIN